MSPEASLIARLLVGAMERSASQGAMERERAEADQYGALVDLARERRGAKMDQVSAGTRSRSPFLIPARPFSGGSLDDVPPGYDEGMVRLASVKAAGLGQALGSAVGGVRSALSGLGRTLKPSLGALGAPKPKTPGTWSAVAPKPALASPAPKPAAVGGGNAGSPLTPPALPPPAQKIQAPAAPQQPQAGAAPKPSLAQQSGLQGGAWKWKLPALGAAALGTYGAVRATKGVANIMSQEAAPANWNAGGMNPAYGVNAYGYPDRSTPFSY